MKLLYIARVVCRKTLLFCLLVLGLLLVSLTGHAVPPPAGVAPVLSPAGGLSIDGDLIANTPLTNNGDWILSTNVPGAGGGVLSPSGVALNGSTTFHLVDPYNSSDDLTFGGGLKWTDNPNSWTWKTGKPSTKTDINNALVHVGNDIDGHSWVIVAADRLSNNGDSYIDFEFLQNTLIRPTTTNHFNSAGPHGGRTVGDLVLSLVFGGGGAVADFFVYRWQPDGSGGFNYVDATASFPSNRVFAALNSNTIATPYAAFGSNIYIPNAFAEAAVDLTALVGNFDPCLSLGFKTIMIKTKTSTSDTSSIEDFMDPIQYNLKVGPSVDAGVAQSRCQEGDSTAFAVQGTATAGLQPIAYTTWTVVDGTATIDFPFSLSTTAHVFSATATLRLTATEANSCTETNDVVLTVRSLPPCSITGASSVCPRSTNQFRAPPGMTGYAWSITGNGSLTGPTNAQTVNATAGNFCGTNFTVVLNVVSNNCSSQCSTDVAVSDTTQPIIVCPPDRVLECTVPPTTNNTGVATATDACSGIASITFLDASDVTNCTGKATILRTWTAIDGCGNTATCLQTISFKDTVPPIIICPTNITLECTVPPTTDNTGVATATDTCSGVTNISFVDAYATTNCTGKGAILRTWTAWDGCGNSNRCVQTISFKDTVPPAIVCPADITLECTVAPTTDITGVATATDTCSSVTNISFVDRFSSTNCTGKGMILRTWSARDACGNSNGCVQTISFQDTVPPVIHCPADITLECTVSPTTNITGVATATDTCSSVTNISFADAYDITNCTGKGMILRTWSAQDACGNSNGCVQTISFKDTVPPVIQCPPNITLECTVEPATDITGVATATDTCSAITNISFVDAFATTNCTGKGMILRTWSAMDSCGNSNGCVQTISFKDTVAPVIVCPADITLECTAAPTTDLTGSATATDTCSVITNISFVDAYTSTNCTGKGMILRTWSAQDACGNSNGCVQTISFKDTVPPVIVCPANITLECTVAPMTNITGMATATDTCSAITNISFVDAYDTTNCTGKGMILRTWSAMDSCGNSNGCVQTISFKDTVPPVIHCPADITLECTVAPTTNITGMATATDTCSAITNIGFVDDLSTTNCTGKGRILRTWSAIDSCGNSNSCVQTISFKDTVPPAIVCPANITIECTLAPTTNLTGVATATDTCSTITNISFADAFATTNCTGKAAILRTWSARDACGNSNACIQTISFKDTVRPVIVCPPDITLECTLSPTTNLTGVAAATDTCSAITNISFADVFATTNCTGKGAILRTWSARDACGNSNGCVQTISFKDTVAPVIVCPANITIECTLAPTTNLTGIATATDTCSAITNISFADGFATTNCTGKAAILRTWSARDACGNSNGCIQTISFKDTVPPVIVCPPDITIECTLSPTTNLTGVATATDTCSAITNISFADAFATTNCTGKGMILRTWSARDACGNSNGCVQTINFKDTVPPVVVCPADITLECTLSPTTNLTGVATATDTCSVITNISFADVFATTNCTGKAMILRTWSARDACGNSNGCVQTISFKDTVPPVIVCPADITIECTLSPTTNLTGVATATDTCSAITNISYADAFATTNCTGKPMILRTWSARDACGNSNGCVQTISFKDTVPPVIVCPADITIECTLAPTTNLTGVATATDTCSVITNISYADVFAATNCTGKAMILRTWSARDACGNSNGCVQTITFKDTVPPVVVCPADITLECTLSPTTNLTGVATATDTCSAVTNIGFADSLATTNCTGKASILRTWSARDACGNSNGCVQTISFKDTVPPVIVCPANITIECTLAPTTNLTGVATATDTCSAITNISYADAFSTTNCTGKAMILRTWSARDACGNSNGCVQTISFKDTVPPAIICPADITIECTLSLTTNLTGVATATDTCSAITNIGFTDVFDTTNCTGKAAILRTWSARDACGNSNGCVQTITFKDTVPPVIVCPPNIAIECTLAPTTNLTGVATATDTCSVITNISFADVLATTNCTGKASILRTWSARDACGNSNGCIQTISFKDTVPPVIICPADITLECTLAPTTNLTGVATATDTCSAVTNISFVDKLSSTNCTGKGMILRTWTARDACGNSNGCVQTISFKDMVPPVIVCPSDMSLECTLAPTTNLTGAATATDTCSAIASISFVDAFGATNCTGKPAIVRTWTARDACGNSNSCVQTITMVDTTKPSITCPAISVQCAGDVPAPYAGLSAFLAAGGRATDTCSPTLTFSLTSQGDLVGSCPGSVTRVYRVTDACGNFAECTQTITVNDTIAPVLTCPPSVAIECGSSLDPANLGGVTATDNCTTNVILTYSDAVVQENFDLKFYVADPDTGTGPYAPTYLEFSPASLPCPDSARLTGRALDPLRNAVAFGTNGQLDALTSIGNVPMAFGQIVPFEAVIQASGGMGPERGTIEFTADWSTYTTSNNRFGYDTNYMVYCAFVDAADPGLIDPNNNARVESYSSTVVNQGTITEAIRGTFRVSGLDPGDRVVVEIWVVLMSSMPDHTGGTVAASLVSAQKASVPPVPLSLGVQTDSLGNLSKITPLPPPQQQPPLGPLPPQPPTSPGATISVFDRTWTATDNCGNSSTCVQRITVRDSTPPALSVPPNRFLECPAMTTPDQTGTATAPDGCGTVTIAYADSVATNCSGTGVITRTWTATDQSGNSTNAVQMITVQDTLKPVLICPKNFVLELPADTTTNATGVASAQDGCSAVTLRYNDLVTTNCGNTRVIARTWTATDQCGNSTNCIQMITVRDTTPPTIVCPTNTTVVSSNAWSFTQPVASDNSGSVTVQALTTVTNVISQTACDVTRTWLAIDACGNTNTCQQTIEVTCASPPILKLKWVNPATLMLSWTATGCQVEASDSLTSPNWAAMAVTPLVINGQNTTQFAPANTRKFYRLRKIGP